MTPQYVTDRLAALTEEEDRVSGEYERLKRQLYEVRRARKNLQWLADNPPEWFDHAIA